MKRGSIDNPGELDSIDSGRAKRIMGLADVGG